MVQAVEIRPLLDCAKDLLGRAVGPPKDERVEKLPDRCF
jgi:hypothetical protein